MAAINYHSVMSGKQNTIIFSCFIAQLIAALTLQVLHFADYSSAVLECGCTIIFMLCMLAFQVFRMVQKKAVIITKEGTSIIIQQVVVLLIVIGFLTYSSVSPLLLCLLEYILYKYVCKYGVSM